VEPRVKPRVLGTVISTSFGYDAAGRLTNLQHKDGAGANLGNYTSTYDAGDRLTNETFNGTAQTDTYDTTNQVAADGVNTYSYDAEGNRSDTGYSTDGSGRFRTGPGGIRTPGAQASWWPAGNCCPATRWVALRRPHAANIRPRQELAPCPCRRRATVRRLIISQRTRCSHPVPTRHRLCLPSTRSRRTYDR
jgi:hypothetical protein